jgi:MFS family permease
VIRRPVFYGWTLTAAILAAWAISIGPRQAFSVFLVALLEDLGGSRSALAGVFSVHMASYALGGWGLGSLMDRVGPKKVIVWSTVAWAVTLVVTSRLWSPWQLYAVYGVVGGVATSGLAYVPNNALLARWFVRYRGLATGIGQASVPLGAAVFGPLAQLGIARWGWRGTQALFGALLAATAIPLVLRFVRDDPAEMGLCPDGAPSAPAVPAAAVPARPPYPLPRGPLGPPRGFWLIFLSNALRGMAMYALIVHQVAYLVDAGFSKMAAATAFSLTFLLAVVGDLASGAISDRVGRLPTYAAVTGLGACAYVSLLLIHGPGQGLLLTLFIVSSGLAWGGISSVYASFLTDRFLGPRLGFLLGLQNIGFGAGATLGPYLAGALFDVQRSYAPSFLFMAAGLLGSSAILWRTEARCSPIRRP